MGERLWLCSPRLAVIESLLGESAKASATRALSNSTCGELALSDLTLGVHLTALRLSERGEPTGEEEDCMLLIGKGFIRGANL